MCFVVNAWKGSDDVWEVSLTQWIAASALLIILSPSSYATASLTSRKLLHIFHFIVSYERQGSMGKVVCHDACV